MNQKWKTDPSLHSCPVKKNGVQLIKQLDYEKVFVEEFLNKDPLKDWESFERCRKLFEWAVQSNDEWEEFIEVASVLDVGSKDGQFPSWLIEVGYDALGLEISKVYVEYAQSKKRPVECGNVCNLTYEDNSFDMVFSHHLLGLTPDINKTLSEMYRVSKRYIISLAEVPGNKKKHYCYIDSPQIFDDFIKNNKCNVLYNDYLDTGYKNEWVFFVSKI